jgi:hypothetical protein
MINYLKWLFTGRKQIKVNCECLICGNMFQTSVPDYKKYSNQFKSDQVYLGQCKDCQ